MSEDDRWWWSFPRSGPPRPVKDGIRARSKKGGFARSWWARRWIAVLEALELGGRLARGRAYARQGQVMDIAIEEGLVRARVQGSRATPYEVTIRVMRLSADEWRRVARVLSTEAVFLAKLLAGEMPGDIESAFAKAGLSLFPSQIDELRTACTCPDPSNPCKHIAAVYYLLGEEFDRDPFLVFRLRGITRDALLRLVEDVSPRARRPSRRGRDAGRVAVPRANPLFWKAGPMDAQLLERAAPEEATLLLARLGPFPFWRGREPLPDALLAVYEKAAAAAAELLAELSAPRRPPAADASAAAPPRRGRP